MTSVQLSIGTEFLWEGRPFRLIRRVDPQRFVALELRFNTEREFTREAIIQEHAEGNLVFRLNFDSQTNSDGPLYSAPSQHGHFINEEEQEILENRWKIIEPLMILTAAPSSEDFQNQAQNLSKEGKTISARTVRRYWNAWKKGGGDRLTLLPRTRRCGRRGRLRQNSFQKRNPQLNRLIEEALRTVYLTLARRPISAVVRHVLEDIQRMNARMLASQAIPVPRKSTLARAIARRIQQLDPWEVDRHRWGKKIADRKHQPTSGQRLATRILQRVEIDHTLLKVLVGTEAGLIGQPWLTVLIDYFSRMIVGFCLGFEPPSYGVLMEALRHAILPKTYVSQKYSQLQKAWPCYGLPELLVCDRGSDFISNDLEKAAFHLHIGLDFNPPRTPHFKGTVESFFGGLNDQLISSLPGRTFRSWERRADYKPEQGPLLGYDALLEIIHVYLVDVYSQDRHPTQNGSRLQAWEENAAEFPPCLPASVEDLLVLLSKSVERNLSPRGIELTGMFYTSPEIQSLRADLAAQNLSTDKLTVRYNPWDLGAIWIVNPLTRRFLKASAVDPALQGMTEYQWGVLRRSVREKFDHAEHQMNLAEGRNKIRDIVDSDSSKPTRKKRTRASRFLHQPQPLLAPVTSPPDQATEGFGENLASLSVNQSLSAPNDGILQAEFSPSTTLTDVSEELAVDHWEVVWPSP